LVDVATAPSALVRAASKAPVPIIPFRAKLLGEYRTSLGNPETGSIFGGARLHRPLDLDGFAKNNIQPILDLHQQQWRWWHPFRQRSRD
jgi:hypothetical protein